MSESFYNTENIEAYITNKMSAGEKAFFENELAKDPLLNNEIELQRDIIDSLKENRKAQLKNRLNNIQIDATSSYTGLKVAASILLAGLVSFGGYKYLNSNKEIQNSGNNTISLTSPEKTINTESSSSNQVIVENQKSVSAENTDKNQNAASNIKGTVIAQNQNGESTRYTRTTTTVTQTTVESNNLPIFNTPEVKDRYEDSDGIKTENHINMPKGDVGNSNGESMLDNLDREIIKDKNHKLAYQYYNNKLFLYGDFDSKPYELLELNTLKDKQLYLYFEGKYYGLKQNQTSITSLTVIEDKQTLSNLELIRNGK
ncbi:MAG: hypothetical protein ACJ75J_11665 [Cytophagaceae bacterium]